MEIEIRKLCGICIAAPRPETLARLTQTGVTLDTQLLSRSTSGTTGTPKTFGVTMTLLAGAILRIAAEPAEACVLRCSSIEYDSTRIYRVMSLLAGRRAAFLPIVSMATLGAFCARIGVTEIHIGTYRLASLLSSPATETDGLPPATRLLTGASRVPGSLRRAVQARLTPNLWISYATSETGVISIAGPDDHPDWPEGVGNVVPGVAVSLRDDAGGCVPRGMIGRAFVCKAGVGPPGHWHDTGDLLSWPPDGPLVFHGRADDMMILNGINVFPGVIEDLLETHPSVAEAVAYPIASAVHGQIPVAAVVLRAPCSAADLLAFARDRLGLLAPRRILIVTEIPRTATGKPKRALMAQMPAA